MLKLCNCRTAFPNMMLSRCFRQEDNCYTSILHTVVLPRMRGAITVNVRTNQELDCSEDPSESAFAPTWQLWYVSMTQPLLGSQTGFLVIQLWCISNLEIVILGLAMLELCRTWERAIFWFTARVAWSTCHLQSWASAIQKSTTSCYHSKDQTPRIDVARFLLGEDFKTFKKWNGYLNNHNVWRIHLPHRLPSPKRLQQIRCRYLDLPLLNGFWVP